jgi:hypothetical protein
MILKNKIFWPILKIFSFCVVLGLSGIIVAPPIMVQSKKIFTKILLFMHNKQRNNSNSKIGVKKILNLVYL